MEKDPFLISWRESREGGSAESKKMKKSTVGKASCRFGESENVLHKKKRENKRKTNMKQKATISTGMKKYDEGRVGYL